MPNYKETKQYIESFATLPEGWHYGSGGSASKTDIAIMTGLLLKAAQLGFRVFEAFPGAEGEIQLAIYDRNNFHSITIEPSAKFTVTSEKNREQVFYKENLTYYDVIDKLENFRFQLWNTSESYTLDKSQHLTVDQPILPSKIPLTGLVSHASRLNAQLRKVQQFADISRSTTQNLSWVIRSYIGRCQTT